MISAPNVMQQSFAPCIIPARFCHVSSPTAMRRYFGAAPMLAISESVTAALIQPICQSLIPATKSVVRWSMSVVTTITWSPQATSAQSSRHFSFPTIPITTVKSSRSSTFAHLLTPFALVLFEYVLDHFRFLFPFMLRLFSLPAQKSTFKRFLPAKSPLPSYLHARIRIRNERDFCFPEYRKDQGITLSKHCRTTHNRSYINFCKILYHGSSPSIQPSDKDNVSFFYPHILSETAKSFFCQCIHHLDRQHLTIHRKLCKLFDTCEAFGKIPVVSFFPP